MVSNVLGARRVGFFFVCFFLAMLLLKSVKSAQVGCVLMMKKGF